METSKYEKIRLKNIEDNKRVLRELGLLNPFNPIPRIHLKNKRRPQKRKATSDERPSKRARLSEVASPGGSVFSNQRRRSSRIQGKDAPTPEDIDEVVESEQENEENKKPTPFKRPNSYGQIEGVEVGRCWDTRVACCGDGIHRPTVAGIHGGPEGCYSLALSGGYEDDIDMGDCFTYTGEGGRDLKGTKANPKNLRTAAQSKDQVLERGNFALSISVETGNPVRVIRGYKLHSPFAPEEGYRYDGLYKVEKFWYTTGLSNYAVYKFALRRLKDQAPPPWDIMDTVSLASSQDSGMGSDQGSEHADDNTSNADMDTETPEGVKVNGVDEAKVNDKPDGDEEVESVTDVKENDACDKDSNNEVKDEIMDEVKENEVSSEVKDKVTAEVKDKVTAEVKDKVMDEVKDKVMDEDKVKDEVVAEVKDKVKDKVVAEVKDKVKAEVKDNVVAEVKDKDKVTAEVKDKVVAEVKENKVCEKDSDNTPLADVKVPDACEGDMESEPLAEVKAVVKENKASETVPNTEVSDEAQGSDKIAAGNVEITDTSDKDSDNGPKAEVTSKAAGDGLYKVEKFWYTTGLSNYAVYKFALRRLKDQAPPPWDIMDTVSLASSQDSGMGSDQGSEHADDNTSNADMDTETPEEVKVNGVDVAKVNNKPDGDEEDESVTEVKENDACDKESNNEVKDEIMDEVKENEVSSEVKDKVTAEVKDKVTAEVKDKVMDEDEVVAEVKDKVVAEVKDKVVAEVKDKVVAEAKDKVKSEVKDKVKENKVCEKDSDNTPLADVKVNDECEGDIEREPLAEVKAVVKENKPSETGRNTEVSGDAQGNDKIAAGNVEITDTSDKDSDNGPKAEVTSKAAGDGKNKRPVPLFPLFLASKKPT